MEEWVLTGDEHGVAVIRDVQWYRLIDVVVMAMCLQGSVIALIRPSRVSSPLSDIELCDHALDQRFRGLKCKFGKLKM